MNQNQNQPASRDAIVRTYPTPTAAELGYDDSTLTAQQLSTGEVVVSDGTQRDAWIKTDYAFDMTVYGAYEDTQTIREQPSQHSQRLRGNY